MPSNPAKGAGFMLQGIGLIVKPGLKRFVLIPLLVNIAVFTTAIWWGAARFDALMARMQANIPGWLSWLEWILWPLFALALLIVVFYSFTLLANFIAAPFNGLLAEKTEALLTGRPANGNATDGGYLKKLLRTLPGTLIDETRKVVYALLWSIPFLLLAFVVPLVGPLIWFLFTAWMLAVQYSDFPMGNHGLKFRDMRAILRRRQFLSIGFGAAAAGLTMIPVVNFIVMPAAVAGATAMWVRELSGAVSSPA